MPAQRRRLIRQIRTRRLGVAFLMRDIGLARENVAIVRKFGLVAIGTAVLTGATALAAIRVPQDRAAPQGRSSPAISAASRSVVLPESEKGTVLRLCSRRGPKVEGSWKATPQQIASLESNLKRISSLRSAGILRGVSIAHPEDCYRQYIPVIVGGRKLIYVNAFCGIQAPGWRTHFVTICDGGESVWGVQYDPATGQFSDLEVNGIA